MQLKRSLILAVVVSIVGLTLWEVFWRFQGKVPDINDDKDLWAVQRAKVRKMDQKDYILIGSSRV
ncbi:MAG: hypothetical protein ACNA7V_07885 [Bacteroidales bacterium]